MPPSTSWPSRRWSSLCSAVRSAVIVTAVTWVPAIVSVPLTLGRPTRPRCSRRSRRAAPGPGSRRTNRSSRRTSQSRCRRSTSRPVRRPAAARSMANEGSAARGSPLTPAGPEAAGTGTTGRSRRRRGPGRARRCRRWPGSTGRGPLARLRRSHRVVLLAGSRSASRAIRGVAAVADPPGRRIACRADGSGDQPARCGRAPTCSGSSPRCRGRRRRCAGCRCRSAGALEAAGAGLAALTIATPPMAIMPDRQEGRRDEPADAGEVVAGPRWQSDCWESCAGSWGLMVSMVDSLPIVADVVLTSYWHIGNCLLRTGGGGAGEVVQGPRAAAVVDDLPDRGDPGGHGRGRRAAPPPPPPLPPTST